MSDKYDYPSMKREILLDEHIQKNKPVLLTQREIADLMSRRPPRRERSKKP